MSLINTKEMFWWFPPGSNNDHGTLQYRIDGKVVVTATLTFHEWFTMNDKKERELQDELVRRYNESRTKS